PTPRRPQRKAPPLRHPPRQRIHRPQASQRRSRTNTRDPRRFPIGRRRTRHHSIHHRRRTRRRRPRTRTSRRRTSALTRSPAHPLPDLPPSGSTVTIHPLPISTPPETPTDEPLTTDNGLRSAFCTQHFAFPSPPTAYCLPPTPHPTKLTKPTSFCHSA